jgi:hypothetical protein
MELRFQLVPRKRIEKAKRAVAVEAERATARRARVVKPPTLSLASSSPDSSIDEATNSTPAPRRQRARAKAAGER